MAIGAAALGIGVVFAAPAFGTASQWTAVSAGARHTCAIKTDTTVWCWGANNAGQLGTGTNTDRTAPTALPNTGTGWTAISAGYDFTCGIRSGTRYCWGANRSGQLGLGDYTNRNTPQRFGNEKPVWSTVSAGLRHACGTSTLGGALCWGDNSSGQLGVGNTTSFNTSQTVRGSINFQSVSAGAFHTCGLDAAGLRYCWGANSARELGMDTIGPEPQLLPYHEPAEGTYLSVEAGDRTTCAVAGGGSRNLVCWGANIYGNAGVGTTTPADGTVSTLNWSVTSSGGYHACAIRATGTAYCWGRDDAGQLGLGSNDDKLTETALPNQNPLWTTISAGLRHTCAIRADKTLYCWGYNVQGQLGIGTTANTSTPTLVP